jgi:hypothetical protein
MKQHQPGESHIAALQASEAPPTRCTGASVLVMVDDRPLRKAADTLFGEIRQHTAEFGPMPDFSCLSLSKAASTAMDRLANTDIGSRHLATVTEALGFCEELQELQEDSPSRHDEIIDSVVTGVVDEQLASFEQAVARAEAADGWSDVNSLVRLESALSKLPATDQPLGGAASVANLAKFAVDLQSGSLPIGDHSEGLLTKVLAKISERGEIAVREVLTLRIHGKLRERASAICNRIENCVNDCDSLRSLLRATHDSIRESSETRPYAQCGAILLPANKRTPVDGRIASAIGSDSAELSTKLIPLWKSAIGRFCSVSNDESFVRLLYMAGDNQSASIFVSTLQSLVPDESVYAAIQRVGPTRCFNAIRQRCEVLTSLTRQGLANGIDPFELDIISLPEPKLDSDHETLRLFRQAVEQFPNTELVLTKRHQSTASMYRSVNGFPWPVRSGVLSNAKAHCDSREFRHPVYLLGQVPYITDGLAPKALCDFLSKQSHTERNNDA